MQIVGTAERQMLCHIFTELPTHRDSRSEKNAQKFVRSPSVSPTSWSLRHANEMKTITSWPQLCPRASTRTPRDDSFSLSHHFNGVAIWQSAKRKTASSSLVEIQSHLPALWHTQSQITRTHPPAAHAWCIIRYCAPRNTKKPQKNKIPKQHASFEPQFTHSTCEAVRRVTAKYTNTHIAE